MKKPYIISIKIEVGSYDRLDLEAIEGDSFASIEDVKKELRKNNPTANEELSIIPLYMFTTDWNDTDDDKEYLDIKSTFISYVYIGE